MKKTLENKKVLLGIGAITAIVAIIAVSSFFPFIIDPTRWQNIDFVTKEVIIVVIIITGTISSMFIGQAKNADDERSNLAKANVRFDLVSKRITDKKSEFRQWVKAVLRPQDTEEKFENLCLRFGIQDKRVFKLSRQQIKCLVDEPRKYDGVAYLSITKRQCKFIIDYLDGKYAINFVPPDYYLTVSSIAKRKTRSEKAGKETLMKASLLSAKLIAHIVRTLLFGMTFASLVYDSATAASDAEMATAWITFVSRMASLIMSCFSGYVIGSQTNDIEAEYINDRCSVQEDFLGDKTFKAKTEQEIAEEAYQEALNKEMEEKKEQQEQEPTPVVVPQSERLMIGEQRAKITHEE